MDRFGYDARLSTGVVAAGGTLGILIPPSTGFVIYAILAQQSIGRLFLAGVLPGILLAVLYAGCAFGFALLNPSRAPAVTIAGRSGEVGDFFLERNIIPLNWDQTLTANFAAQIGAANNWSVGFISQMATGQPYTPEFLDPNKNFPDNEFLNAGRKPVIFTFDVSAEKRFAIKGVRYGLRLQVDNVFNHLNERTVDAISGRADQIVRLPVVQADRNLVNNVVGLFSRTEDDTNPNWYSAPRQVRFAVTVNF